MVADSVLTIIRLLADGKVHSGEELGEILGVSRTAVWKQLKKLENIGLSLNIVKGKGYQLERGIELLEADEIQRNLTDEVANLVLELDLHRSIGSTNSHAISRANSGDSHGYICLAEHQSEGRGRHGRRWISPFARNVYLSIVWEYDGGAAVLEGLSLAVGVAIVQALSENGIEGVQLKWPNDLLWKGKKLAGVLLEMTGDAAGRCKVIVGIGLNVGMLSQEASEVDQAWVGLSSINDGVSRNKLVSSLLNNLLPLLDDYDEKGFAPLRDAWESLDYFRENEVEIRSGEQITVGKVCGVTDSGALRLQNRSGEQLIFGGEASLRRPS
ncbi:bifunctional biotin--[acetyl-CoA-carboxylase] ligase/biotin operon repressor BirA [Aurantivibrio infirmus]